MDAFMEELTGAQWQEWCEFFALEPTGNNHVDWLWGALLALIENVNRTKGPLAKPEDVLPYLATGQSEPGELTEADVVAKSLRWRSVARATGGKVT